MIIWACVLFVLGILAFLDSLFAFGGIFRRVNAFMFLLVSLGLLFEIRYMRRPARPTSGESGTTYPAGSKEPIPEGPPPRRATVCGRHTQVTLCVREHI